MKGGEDAIRAALAHAEEARGDKSSDKLDKDLVKKLLNDSGNSERFRARYGRDLMFVPQIGRFAWTGSHWSTRVGDQEWSLAAQKTAQRIMWNEAPALEAMIDAGEINGDAKRLHEFREWAKDSGNRARLSAMQSVSEPHLQHHVDGLDANPFLFNVQNGTLELGTKKDPVEIRRRRFSRLDRITRISPVGYDPNAPCNLFRGFLESILPDSGVQDWLQRWFGYCLTADYGEHVLAAFWGEGRNGKGTLIKLFQWLLGDYAATIEFATLLDDRNRRGSEASPDLAKLPGMRAVFAGEPKKGARLDDGRIKEITGGDTLTVRKLNRDFFDLVPTFKLTLAFNNKPRIQDDTHGMWSRMRLVPFTVVVPDEKQDHHLLGKLKAEGPGVLNWALDGFRMWRERGLSAPQAILSATAEYRTESDRIGSFLDAATRPEPEGKIKSTELYACYEGFARAMEFRPVSQTLFGRELTKRGIKANKDSVIYRLGIKWSGVIDWDWQAPYG